MADPGRLYGGGIFESNYVSCRYSLLVIIFKITVVIARGVVQGNNLGPIVKEVCDGVASVTSISFRGPFLGGGHREDLGYTLVEG